MALFCDGGSGSGLAVFSGSTKGSVTPFKFPVKLLEISSIVCLSFYTAWGLTGACELTLQKDLAVSKKFFIALKFHEWVMFQYVL